VKLWDDDIDLCEFSVNTPLGVGVRVEGGGGTESIGIDEALLIVIEVTFGLERGAIEVPSVGPLIA